MLLFHYINRLKCLLRDKETVFWTLLFPILLATLFNIAFGSITSATEMFSPVATAVIDNQAYQDNVPFKEALKAVSSGEQPLLKVSVLSQDQAEQKLKEGEISGIITVSDGINLRVINTGLYQSLIKSFLDEYLQIEKTAGAIIESNPSAVQNGLFNSLADRRNYTDEISFSGAEPDTFLAYFYALIAMACLYGSFWGLRNVIDIQANLSPLGARRSVSPTHKLTSIVCDQLAALTIHFAEILITICYLVFVLGVDFGKRGGLVVLICFVGSVTGISLGTFVGSAIRKNEKVKYAMLNGISLSMSFLAGLMFIEMKYIVAQNVPLLSYINPAALLSDAFYSLNIYESLTRFYLNFGLLCSLSVLLSVASYMLVRREKYASI
ncbi:MAG: ABC transporter permease [Oscillospiraceae bacterium]|nr:ABC transporter permease [Oscillospiraceae bacterium]MDD3832715.1 ABC transporter permease [Oscillospiraceae bacterium]MDD4547009.1 ABC transporter permease [Oscillospiraceae bacterium]